jgi:hypothetical protein
MAAASLLLLNRNPHCRHYGTELFHRLASKAEIEIHSLHGKTIISSLQCQPMHISAQGLDLSALTAV